MPEFYAIFARKINKISECYTTFARKMAKYYIMFARKYFRDFFFWGGGGAGQRPFPSPMPMAGPKASNQLNPALQ